MSHPEGSIANVIERYVVEMNGTPDRVGLKPLGVQL